MRLHFDSSQGIRASPPIFQRPLDFAPLSRRLLQRPLPGAPRRFPSTDYLLDLTDDPRRPAEQGYKAVADGIDDLIERAAAIKRHLQGEAGVDDEP